MEQKITQEAKFSTKHLLDTLPEICWLLSDVDCSHATYHHFSCKIHSGQLEYLKSTTREINGI